MTATITEHWHELVTTSLLGTDRRDPPAPPAGPLADVVDDALEPTPSSRMLTAVAACVAARRAGLLPHPPAAPLSPPDADPRPLLSPAASRRWRSIVATWPVLEDEWLHVVGRRGYRVPADVLVGLLERHRRDADRWARVVRVGGPVVPWLLDHQPALRPPASWRPAGEIVDGVPPLAVAPQLAGLLDAGPELAVPATIDGLAGGTFGVTHGPVLVNFVARARPDTLGPLAEALVTADVPAAVGGLAHSLADLASTRRHMLEELAADDR
jgi:hypothetical protein